MGGFLDGTTSKDKIQTEIKSIKKELDTYSDVLNGISIKLKKMPEDNIDMTQLNTDELTKLGDKIHDASYELKQLIIDSDYQRNQSNSVQKTFAVISSEISSKSINCEIGGGDNNTLIIRKHVKTHLKGWRLIKEFQSIGEISIRRMGHQSNPLYISFSLIDSDEYDYIKSKVIFELQNRFHANINFSNRIPNREEKYI